MTQDTEATEEFCQIFDKFFDLLILIQLPNVYGRESQT